MIKTLKNLLKSFGLSFLTIIIIGYVNNFIMNRGPRFSAEVTIFNLLLVLVLLTVASFVYFNSSKDTSKKKSRNLFVIFIVYAFISSFLVTLTSPWKHEKVDVAWQEPPLYISSTKDDKLILTVRWEENYQRRILIKNSSCYQSGGYELRLKDNSIKYVNTWEYNNNSLEVSQSGFDGIPGILGSGKKILLLSDACGNQHELDVTGYYNIRKFREGRY